MRYKSVFFFLLLLQTGCRKEMSISTGVPMVPVNIVLYVNNPGYAALNAIGGWMYVDGGVKGILIYRDSPNSFRAYDRNCTFQPLNICSTVYVDNTQIIAVDTCCGSKFSIVDGSVINGPAALSLQQYFTSYDGNLLHVYN